MSSINTASRAQVTGQRVCSSHQSPCTCVHRLHQLLEDGTCISLPLCSSELARPAIGFDQPLAHFHDPFRAIPVTPDAAVSANPFRSIRVLAYANEIFHGVHGWPVAMADRVMIPLLSVIAKNAVRLVNNVLCWRGWQELSDGV